MIGYINNILDENNINNLTIHGQMSVEKRETVIKEFKDKNIYTALILSLKASSTGLNLTMANNVLIVDPWWNVTIFMK